MELMSESEWDEVRDVARTMLAARSPSSRVRQVASSTDAFDKELWAEMAHLGWMAIEPPERLGGSAMGFNGLAVLLVELGRSLTGPPFLSSAVLGLGALLASPNERLQATWIPPIARGDRLVTVVIGDLFGQPAGVRTVRSPSGWAMTGTSAFVPDARSADAFIVLARSSDGNAVLALVEADAWGLEVAEVPTLDVTRTFGRAELNDVQADATSILAVGADAERIAGSVMDRAAVGVACDSLGIAMRALEMTIAYAKEREQFGHPIGAFQAVKHQCSDLFVEIQAATTVVEAAVDAIASDRPDASALASMAKFVACRAGTNAAGTGIQLHGGIGYTWEHDMHLLFRRAQLDNALCGDGRWHRRRLAALMFGAERAEREPAG